MSDPHGAKSVRAQSRAHDFGVIVVTGLVVGTVLAACTLIFTPADVSTDWSGHIVYFAVGFGIGSAITTFISRRRQRSKLESLRSIVQQRLEAGDFSALPRTREPEIDDLIGDINDLLVSAQQKVQVTSTITTAAQTQAQESTLDSLTGLHNRSYLTNHLSDEVNRTKALNDVLSLIMLDVDHFKHYNDTQGHQMGDTVLQGVGSILKKTVRALDVCVRYGGEEFVVLLPRTSLERARLTAERIRKAIGTHQFPAAAQQPEGAVTVSLGVASCPQDAMTGEELIKQADDALYAAKGAGRNCVMIAGEKQQGEGDQAGAH